MIAAPPGTGQTGAYQFRLFDATGPAPTFAAGDTVSGTLSPGNSAALYHFQGTAGQHLLLHNLSTLALTDSNSVWTLYDPTGHGLRLAWLFYQNNVHDIDVVLPFTGTYTLVLSGAATANAPYSFQAIDLS